MKCLGLPLGGKHSSYNYLEWGFQVDGKEVVKLEATEIL